MMDEAEKYQQRLQAIAEKRRLQEEEERAKRDMEDERLRLQQLKRKSLRDQWLMEGPPLSPTSSEGSQGPRSPPWGSHAQEIEKNIDKLQTETQRLAEEEEEEKLKEQMEDGQTEPIEETEVTTEAVQEAVVQNGQEETSGSDTAEDEMKNLSPLPDGPAAVITNGRGEEEVEDDEANHVASEESPPPPTTNGLTAAPPEGTVTMTFLGYSEAESHQAADSSIDEAAEEGTLVMRAERVIITDEGDEVTYDVTSQGEEEEVGEGSEEAAPHLQSSETTEEGGEQAAEEPAEAEAVPQASTEPENSIEITEVASSSPATEIDTTTADGEMGDSVETNDCGEVEITTEGEEKSEAPASEAPASDSPLPSADAPDAAAVASVPVYSESPPSPGVTVRAEAEGETTEPTAQTGGEESDVAVQEDPTPEEEAEASSTPHVPEAAVPEGQFQDVPLADPQESPRTDAGEQPGEQEPLLSQTKAPEITQAELPAAAANTETHIPARANQGGEAAAPKSKNCQCCSVM